MPLFSWKTKKTELKKIKIDKYIIFSENFIYFNLEILAINKIDPITLKKFVCFNTNLPSLENKV